LKNKGGPYDMLGSSNVSANLGCGEKQLFYRQCISACFSSRGGGNYLKRAIAQARASG
jgi:hypothetical protein